MPIKRSVSPGVHPTLLILVDDPVDDVGQQHDERPHPAQADQHVDVPVRYYEAVHQHPETGTKILPQNNESQCQFNHNCILYII